MTFKEWKQKVINEDKKEAYLDDDTAEICFEDSEIESLEDIPEDFINDPEGFALKEIANWNDKYIE